MKPIADCVLCSGTGLVDGDYCTPCLIRTTGWPAQETRDRVVATARALVNGDHREPLGSLTRRLDALRDAVVGLDSVKQRPSEAAPGFATGPCPHVEIDPMFGLPRMAWVERRSLDAQPEMATLESVAQAYEQGRIAGLVEAGRDPRRPEAESAEVELRALTQLAIHADAWLAAQEREDWIMTDKLFEPLQASILAWRTAMLTCIRHSSPFTSDGENR
jgi:hypothetical protein